MDEQLNELLAIGNLFEAGLWMVFAATFAVMAIRSSGRKRRLWSVLAIGFVAFAASDVIESRTGAWWHPLWLLALKGGCLALFLISIWEYRRIRWAERPAEQLPSDTMPTE